MKIEGMPISHELTCRYVRADENEKPAGHCRHGMKYNRHGRLDCTDKAGNIPGRTSIYDRLEGQTGDASTTGKWTRQQGGTARVRYSSSRNIRPTSFSRRNSNTCPIFRYVHCHELFDFIPMEKPGHSRTYAAGIAIRLLLPYRGGGRGKTMMTTDNGSEFPTHRKITEAMKGTAICFADPYSSWQKGAIGNADKLIRQYVPKGTDFSNPGNSLLKRV